MGTHRRSTSPSSTGLGLTSRCTRRASARGSAPALGEGGSDEKVFRRLVPVLTVLALLANHAYAEWVYVERVVDGDTFVTSDGTKVRVSGIDTPETKHPTKGEETGGQSATQLATFFLQGNYVWLDGNATDKYGRRVAKVQLPGGNSYADVIKAHGYDKESGGIYSLSTVTPPKTKVARNPYPISSAEMTWVDGYTRSDGTYVAGHWRKKTTPTSSTSSSYYTPPACSGGSSSSGSTFTGDKSVHINGYYRKDGSYVKPHSRSAPKSKK